MNAKARYRRRRRARIARALSLIEKWEREWRWDPADREVCSGMRAFARRIMWREILDPEPWFIN